MGKTITINVTARRIERAKKMLKRGGRRGGCCPVALAAKAVVPGFQWAGCTQLRIDGQRYIYLPPKAQQFIAAFDAKGVVRPFKFKVTIP